METSWLEIETQRNYSSFSHLEMSQSHILLKYDVYMYFVNTSL